jgi:D-threo-aldose 1-dehydrogenase
MMRDITLPGTDLSTTALGFGCAGIFAEPSARGRRRLLDAAYAAGVRHFDVAPMYGLGRAESELGRFATGRADPVVVATKFGIDPTPVGRALGRVQGPVRRVLAAMPSLRATARANAKDAGSGGAGALLYRSEGYGAEAARASLERSLRRLGMDHVDLFLLHEPQPADPRSDDVCAYLDEARDSGLIRAWGVAGEPAPALAVAGGLPADVPVLQVHADVLMPAELRGRLSAHAARITFGVLGQALATIVRHVGGDAERRRRWHEAVGCDCAIPEQAARVMLRHAVKANPFGVVLFSSTREAHMSAAAAAVEGATADPGTSVDVDAFAALVADELPARMLAA